MGAMPHATAFLEAPRFVCNALLRKARPPKRGMQLIVTFNIKNTITWVQWPMPPHFWGLRLVYATHCDH